MHANVVMHINCVFLFRDTPPPPPPPQKVLTLQFRICSEKNLLACTNAQGVMPVRQNPVPCRSGKTLCRAGPQNTVPGRYVGHQGMDRRVKAVTVRQNPILARHTLGGGGGGGDKVLVSHLHGS